MASFAPVYRLTIYRPRSQNDATESQILAPAAGAPHADLFRVATATGITGFQPYLALPMGRKGKIDPVGKKLDVGSFSFVVMNKALTPGVNASRWVSAFVGDAKGRRVLGGCKVLVEESLDGGGSFAAFSTGRVQRVTGESRLWTTIQVRELEDDLKFTVFTGDPHGAATTYAFRPYYLPTGLPQAYGEAPVVSPFTGMVRAPSNIPTNRRYFTVDGDPFGSAMASRVLLKALSEVISGSASDLARHRLVVTRLDTMTTGEYLCTGAVGNEAAGPAVVAGVFALELPSSDPAYLAFPPTGTAIRWYLRTRQAPASREIPIVVNDVHPVQLWQHVLDGYFGERKTDGSPLVAIPYDAAAFAAMIADTSIPLLRGIFVKPEAINELIESVVCKPNHLAYRLDGLGRVVPVDLRIATARTVAAAITDDDLVSTQEGEGWEEDGTDAVTRILATNYLDQEVVVTTGDVGTFPDAPLTRLTSVAEKRVYLNGSDRAGDLLTRDITIDARGLRRMAGEKLTSTGRAMWIEAQLRRLAAELDGPFGLGATTVRLKCRRTANTAVVPGQWVTVTVSTIPNPATNQLGGTRLMLVLERAENGIAVDLELLDAGANSAAVAPTLSAPAQNAAQPKHAVDIPVTLNALSEQAEVWVCVTDTSVSVRPADTDARWVRVRGVTASGTTTADQIGAGRRVWPRARTVPIRTDAPKLASAWAWPPGAGYADTQALVAPSGLGATNIARHTADLAWSAGEAAYDVEVFLHAGASAPATWSLAERAQLLPAGTTRYPANGLDGPSAQHVAAVRHIDAYGGVSAVATVSFSTGTTAAVAPTPLGLRVVRGA